MKNNCIKTIFLIKFCALEGMIVIMQVFLIKEEKEKSIFDKLFSKIKIEDDIVILNYNIKQKKFKNKIKIVNKLTKELLSKDIKNIIISKELKKDEEFVNLLYGNGFNIIDGRILFKKLIHKILEKIIKENNIKSKESQISIVVNNNNKYAIELVQNLSKKFKSLNIVTNNMDIFKNIKNRLWEEEGIIITVTNNKKKALLKSDIIINIDFSEEWINKYTLKDNGILINLEECIKIKKKRFNGKIINNYNIQLKERTIIKEELEKNKYKDFDVKDLAEVYIMNDENNLQDLEVL